MSSNHPEFYPAGLKGCQVALLGLGLMGGSLALALRGHCAGLRGYDSDPLVRKTAVQRGIVDFCADNPAEALAGSHLVVLAVPVRTILALLGELPLYHAGQAVVLDLGSTKVEVVRAMETLPARFDPLGGHPMCGKEKGGLEAADGVLFVGRAFAFTPLARTSPRARTLAAQLALACGARPCWLEAETHDRWTAATSHLPYLVANALAGTTPIESAPLVGTGFTSTTRIASTPVGMMHDVLLTNQGNILAALARFHARLDQLEACLSQGDEAALDKLLQEGAQAQEKLVPHEPLL